MSLFFVIIFHQHYALYKVKHIVAGLNILVVLLLLKMHLIGTGLSRMNHILPDAECTTDEADSDALYRNYRIRVFHFKFLEQTDLAQSQPS